MTPNPTDSEILREDLALKIAARVVSACKEKLIEAYEDAGVSGLCGEGRWEVALGSLDSIDLKELIGDLGSKA